jgi:hypothetical protein
MLRAVVLALCVHQAASFCGPALPLGGSLRKATSCGPMMVSSEDGGRRAALGRVGLALAAPFLPLSPLAERASAAEAGQVTKVEDVDRGYSFEYPAGMLDPTSAMDCFCCPNTFFQHRESVCGEMETYEPTALFFAGWIKGTAEFPGASKNPARPTIASFVSPDNKDVNVAVVSYAIQA